MLHRNLVFFLTEAIKNLRTNFYLHLTIILIISISFSVFGIILIFETNIENILKSISKDLTLEVFLKDEAKEDSDDFLKLKKFLNGYPLVKTVLYISSPQAYSDFKKDFRQYSSLVEEIGDNPFPASFRLFLRERPDNRKELTELISILSRWKSVEDLSLSKDWVDHFYSFVSLVRMSVWLLIALITVGMVLIIYNGIKLTIHSKSQQIEIMKLVGASNWFIRGQFIFEGMLEGIIGALFSMLFLLFTYRFLFNKITDAFSFIFPKHSFCFLSVDYTFLIFGAGIILGLLGGILSSSKFLKDIY